MTERSVHCPICSAGRELAPLDRTGEFQLYLCGSCDVVFADPMRSPGSAWYDGAYQIRHLAIDDRIREYYRWALGRLPPGCRVLDVGCGEGTFVAYARRRGFDAWGIDFSSAAIEAGRRRYGLTTLATGSLSDLRRADTPGFEAVTAFEVLEHMESPVAFLADIGAFLPPGGHLVLSVPNRDRWPFREFGDYPPNHLTRWSDPALRRAARVAGLTVVALSQTSRLQSINAMFGYVPRLMLYAAVGQRTKGIAHESNVWGRFAGRLPLLGPVGSAGRRLRDLLMWVPALVAAPLVWRRVRGYNLMLYARRLG